MQMACNCGIPVIRITRAQNSQLNISVTMHLSKEIGWAFFIWKPKPCNKLMIPSKETV